MNEQEQDRFEAELRRTPPARLPDHFIARLTAAKPYVEDPAPRERNQPTAAMPLWWADWRWLTPALAVAVVGLLVARSIYRDRTISNNWGIFNNRSAEKQQNFSVAYGMKADGMKADDVQVDRQLVSSYDVVAKLPEGPPVRFHCQKWNDQVVVKDTNGETVIEQDRPRVEVVPVRFETY